MDGQRGDGRQRLTAAPFAGRDAPPQVSSHDLARPFRSPCHTRSLPQVIAVRDLAAFIPLILPHWPKRRHPERC
jgi:hypothetical protein